MKKSSLSIAMIALFTAASASAGDLNSTDDNTLNQFVSGTPAVAAEVNDNFDKVADAVNDNHERITANTAAISESADAIVDLEVEINANTAAIADNAADIAANTAAITANTADIATNSDATAANAAGVAANSLAITANAADTATNTANIATNAAGIAANAVDILDLTNEVAGNTAAIATNTADIATNTAATTANADAIAALQQGGNTTGTPCAGNDAGDIMVRVGPLCVDKYEASVWSAADGGTQYGVAEDDYPCLDNGNDCTVGAANPIYARSEAGVIPAAHITWFQAQQACGNAGKRLMSNAEWQMAAAGTPDPGLAGSDATNFCNTDSGARVATGSSEVGTEPCVSNWGVTDMVGNVNEWTADWFAGTGTSSGASTPNSETYGGDEATNILRANTQVGGSQFPAILYRGGGFSAGTLAGVFAINGTHGPALSAVSVGFRCAR